MGDEVYSAGTPEEELERSKKVLVMPEGERGKLAWVMLTNDRILFTQQKWDAGVGGGALTAVLADQLQKHSEKKSGGPRELIRLGDVTGIKKIRRRMRGDIYEFTMSDGSTCAVGAEAMKKWDGAVRRLLSERHGRTVSEAGEDSWSVA
jgi:hypothetical protein